MSPQPTNRSATKILFRFPFRFRTPSLLSFLDDAPEEWASHALTIVTDWCDPHSPHPGYIPWNLLSTKAGARKRKGHTFCNNKTRTLPIWKIPLGKLSQSGRRSPSAVRHLQQLEPRNNARKRASQRVKYLGSSTITKALL